jgi:hypothetical protein
VYYTSTGYGQRLPRYVQTSRLTSAPMCHLFLIYLDVQSLKARRLLRRMKVEKAAAIKIQSRYKGRRVKRAMLEPRRRFRNSIHIQRVWRGCVARREAALRRLLSRVLTEDDWDMIKAESSRTLYTYRIGYVPKWEEFTLRRRFGMKFYYDVINFKYQIVKPQEWVARDISVARQNKQIRERGYSDEMWTAAVVLQKSYRGRVARVYFNNIRTGVAIMKQAEVKYLADPQNKLALYNYALYHLAITRDNTMARKLWNQIFNAMVMVRFLFISQTCIPTFTTPSHMIYSEASTKPLFCMAIPSTLV